MYNQFDDYLLGDRYLVHLPFSTVTFWAVDTL